MSHFTLSPWRPSLPSWLYINIQMESLVLDVFFLKTKTEIFFLSNFQTLVDIKLDVTSEKNGI